MIFLKKKINLDCNCFLQFPYHPTSICHHISEHMLGKSGRERPWRGGSIFCFVPEQVVQIQKGDPRADCATGTGKRFSRNQVSF